jgi:hypothetical protein
MDSGQLFSVFKQWIKRLEYVIESGRERCTKDPAIKVQMALLQSNNWALSSSAQAPTNTLVVTHEAVAECVDSEAIRPNPCGLYYVNRGRSI